MDEAPHELLFEPMLIPTWCHGDLGSDLQLRPLANKDHQRGHFELLSVLTTAPPISHAAYEINFRRMKSCLDTYFTIVIVHRSTEKLVACGTIVVERKFTHGGSLIGHIEDIAVSKSMQGRKLGLKIINTLEAIGRGMGCYKIILDCSKENIPFYEKCGFKHKEFQMVQYLEDPQAILPITPSRL